MLSRKIVINLNVWVEPDILGNNSGNHSWSTAFQINSKIGISLLFFKLFSDYSICFSHMSCHHLSESPSHRVDAIAAYLVYCIVSFWRRKWQHTPVSCLENPMDWGAWQDAVHGVAKSQTWLSRPAPFLASPQSIFLWWGQSDLPQNASMSTSTRLERFNWLPVSLGLWLSVFSVGCEFIYCLGPACLSSSSCPHTQFDWLCQLLWSPFGSLNAMYSF